MGDPRTAFRSVFEHTAEVLERSANLADEHAARKADDGCEDVATEERRRADWAREQAQLARARASRR